MTQPLHSRKNQRWRDKLYNASAPMWTWGTLGTSLAVVAHIIFRLLLNENFSSEYKERIALLVPMTAFLAVLCLSVSLLGAFLYMRGNIVLWAFFIIGQFTIIIFNTVAVLIAYGGAQTFLSTDGLLNMEIAVDIFVIGIVGIVVVNLMLVREWMAWANKNWSTATRSPPDLRTPDGRGETFK